VRGLKQSLRCVAAFVDHDGQKGTNPREGIETSNGSAAIEGRLLGCQKGTNPREGIETILRWLHGRVGFLRGSERNESP